MTGNEALAILAQAQELLRQQAAALGAEGIDLDQAELLGDEITRLLSTVPAAERLDGLDDTLRARLLTSARQTAAALAASATALDQHRRNRLDARARTERDGAALRSYLPRSDGEPARFFDERR
ncbi:MAG TPA: hypothetical protein VHX44_08250 [Planctomycetota bacterium]|nr:hypothetical protein [Planctomycetota bacterium]